MCNSQTSQVQVKNYIATYSPSVFTTYGVKEINDDKVVLDYIFGRRCSTLYRTLEYDDRGNPYLHLDCELVCLSEFLRTNI